MSGYCASATLLSMLSITEYKYLMGLHICIALIFGDVTLTIS